MSLKLLEVRIKPTSLFRTPLKGDTLFGHICFMLYSFGEDLQSILEDYETNPFLVVSTPYPCLDDARLVKIPDLPLYYWVRLAAGTAGGHSFDYRLVRELKSVNYLRIDSLADPLDLTTPALLTRDGLPLGSTKENHSRLIEETLVQHNAINRAVGTTTGEEFAPYTHPAVVYKQGLVLWLLCAFDSERISKDRLHECLEIIGKWGYGADATVGYGRFEVISVQDGIDVGAGSGHKYWVCLSPVCLEKEDRQRGFYTPFVRFGKHGSMVVGGKMPFKAPVQMFDDGAFLVSPKSIDKASYIFGRGIRGVSTTIKNAVHQGYAIGIPAQVREDILEGDI